MSSHPSTNLFFHNIITENFLQAQLAHLPETHHIIYVIDLSACWVDENKDTMYWGTSKKLSLPMKHKNTAHDGFFDKRTPISQLNSS